METITLHFDQNIKEKLLKVLNSFSKNELKIVEETQEFQDAKSEIQKDNDYTLRDDAEFYSVEEVNEMLEKSVDSVKLN